ncbi:hypothetical protein BJ742DRAFT_775534 [Cladochytrium replicatum]|nr:hypothetical protein BJ742DRAFT_775534 [Cladochytrium replicatum]
MPIQSLHVSALWATVGSSLGVRFVVGAASIALENGIVYDLSGSITFGVCTFISFLSRPSPPSRLQPHSTRANSFSEQSRPAIGEDQEEPHIFPRYVGIQAVWVSMTALSVWRVNSVPLTPALELKDHLGAAVWAFGFIHEAVADAQKDAWARRRLLKKADDEPFIRTGLFARSRFPHYFGELTRWTGVYVASLGLFANPTDAYYPSWTRLAAASGVAFETYLLTRLSGVPLTDRHHKKLHGNNLDYIKYKKETPMVFPKLW